MEVVMVETKIQLRMLYESNALTWEGLSEQFYKAAFMSYSLDTGKCFVIKGKVMNELCKLTGNNAYPDNLNIFSLNKYQDLALTSEMRYMRDIIDTNARRQKYHPFRGSIFR